MNNFLMPSEFGSNPRWITGIVEDRADPQQRGRVRVRYWGYYSDDIPTEELPWSTVIQDITSAGIGGMGTSPTGIMVGTVVLGTFLDGNSMQHPAVIGVVGPIDGIVSSPGFNDGTMNANGVLDNGVVGPNTPSNVNFVGEGPAWLQAARGELGVKEVAGAGNSQRVLQYAATNGFSDDKTPWCSSFCKWCMQQAGQSTSGVTGMARSWLTAGSMERLTDPLHGCIVVKSRGNPPSGHVAFLEKIQGGRVVYIGGNQSDAVTVSGCSPSQVLGYMWPRGASKQGFGF